MEMFKQNIKKEVMYSMRSFRLWGILIAFLLSGISIPLLDKASVGLLEYSNSILEEVKQTDSGIDTSMYDSLMGDPSMELLTSLEYNLYVALTSLTELPVLLTLIILMGTAGGELKKRQMIIPKSTGMRFDTYIVSKFTFYIPIVFIISVLSSLACASICQGLFEGTVNYGNVLIASMLIGTYNAFVVAAMLFMGLCTEKPGLSVVIITAITFLLGFFLPTANVNYYNPFALTTQAGTLLFNGVMPGVPVQALDYTNMAVSVAVTVVLIVIFVFTTLFVFRVKEIDNTDNLPTL
jgi:hypothetical protein